MPLYLFVFQERFPNLLKPQPVDTEVVEATACLRMNVDIPVLFIEGEFRLIDESEDLRTENDGKISGLILHDLAPRH